MQEQNQIWATVDVTEAGVGHLATVMDLGVNGVFQQSPPQMNLVRSSPAPILIVISVSQTGHVQFRARTACKFEFFEILYFMRRATKPT